MNDATELLRLRSLSKTYNAGQPNEVQVLHTLDLGLARGEFVALIGPSGSGKSTLLNILGLLERPSSGEHRLLGQAVQALSDDELTRLRRGALGFVFQFHHLLPAFSAIENVTLPALVRDGHVGAAQRARGLALLKAVGLADAVDRRPAQLSGGEQQRAALARATVTRPRLLLADEPTGNLDQETGADVIDLLFSLQSRHGATLLLITHDPGLAERCDRVVGMRDGRLVESPARLGVAG